MEESQEDGSSYSTDSQNVMPAARPGPTWIDNEHQGAASTKIYKIIECVKECPSDEISWDQAKKESPAA